MNEALGLIVFLLVAAVLLKPLFDGFRLGMREDDEQPAPDYQLEVVGEASYQKNLLAIAGPKGANSAQVLVTASVIFDDDNPHDARAVRVDIQGKTVGYLSRENARRWRKTIGRSPVNCHAVIRGGWDRGNGNTGYFGVWLQPPRDFQ